MPGGFVNRLAVRAEASLDRLHPAPRGEPITSGELLDALAQRCGIDLRPFLAEAELQAIEREVLERIERLERTVGPSFVHNADLRLARLCYAVCRACRPVNAVETGVANGVTSSYLLQALAVNGEGSLHSVDLGGDEAVGRLIPGELKGHWRLHRGSTGKLLEPLLRELGRVGVFVQDSRHTYRNIRRELAAVSPYLAAPAGVLVDDVERSSAFADWVRDRRPTYSAVLAPEAKPALFGLAVFLQRGLDARPADDL